MVVASYAAPQSVTRRRVAQDRVAFVETGDWLGMGWWVGTGWAGWSTVEVTCVYRTTSTIQIFAVLSSVIFVMLGV